MIEISLAIREACERSGIRSDGQPPHKGDFIEKRRKPCLRRVDMRAWQDRRRDRFGPARLLARPPRSVTEAALRPQPLVITAISMKFHRLSNGKFTRL
jgi:hypothetical protein